MTRRRFTMFLVGLLALAVLVAPGASAGKPTFERLEIDETVPDPFLTAECGFPVSIQSQGHIIVRTFSGEKTGVVQVTTLNIINTVRAGARSYPVRDVGADVVRIEPDGTAILMIIGQTPFGFTGVLKIDLETGEAILEPHHSLEGRIADACAALAP
ncbi:MAG TPA: hypothetical protein VNP93_07485 [Gaiellaceae bacterium]|nr:hypothetical protein [Gaiellaceae bacterium]